MKFLNYFLLIIILLIIGSVIFHSANAVSGQGQVASNKKLYIGIGSGQGGVTASRLSMLIDNRESYNIMNLYLHRYTDAGLNFWYDDTTSESIKQNQSLSSASLATVFFISNAVESNIFGELGLGISLLSKNQISGRNLGSNYQFETRIGLGYKGDTVDTKFTIFHYSNGDTQGANRGMDVLMLSIGFDI